MLKVHTEAQVGMMIGKVMSDRRIEICGFESRQLHNKTPQGREIAYGSPPRLESCGDLVVNDSKNYEKDRR